MQAKLMFVLLPAAALTAGLVLFRSQVAPRTPEASPSQTASSSDGPAEPSLPPAVSKDQGTAAGARESIAVSPAPRRLPPRRIASSVLPNCETSSTLWPPGIGVAQSM